jgi:hypothetical protein
MLCTITLQVKLVPPRDMPRLGMAQAFFNTGEMMLCVEK